MPQNRPRVPRFALVALLLLILSAAVGTVAIGADPDSGTVSTQPGQTNVGWNGERFAAAASVSRDICEVPGQCDEFALSVPIDPSHWETHSGGVEVVITSQDAADDFDLYVLDENGDEVGSSANSDVTTERVMIEKASGEYTVVVNPYTVTDADYKGGAILQSRADVPAGDVPTEPVSNLDCTGGKAGPFPCKDVDLKGFLPIAALNDGEGEDLTGDPVELNDIWGWTDPQTGREYAIVGKTIGTAFVDITDASNPRYLGSLPSHQPVPTIFKTWRDIKVHENHAYIGSEEPLHGLQVFDLTQLRGVTEPQTFEETAHYAGFGNSHNIAINEDSGFLYAIGTSTCQGGPHVVDIRDPASPQPAGCVFEDGYTHDAQCVNYEGPDTRYAGREICFNSNEDTLTIVDVTNKLRPVQLSRTPYEGASYTHQGWLTEDGRSFLVNDELDEQELGTPTTTRVFDVEKLDNPTLRGSYVAKVKSIDHNLYTKGSTVFEANYRSGLRVLDASRANSGELSEVGFFDVYPADDEAEFNGSWSNFPYYDSGVVVVSGIEQGLFVLKPRLAAGATGSPSPAPTATAASAAKPAAPAACSSSTALRSVRVTRRGTGLRLGFTRGTAARVGVDVFQQSAGRRVVGERLVARFTGRAGSVAWNGRANRRGRSVADGVYVVRYRAAGETRRVTLRRERGRWRTAGAYARTSRCGLVRSLKAQRPVFGGTTSRPLSVSYRLARQARVTVTVLRGKRVVKRYAATTRRAGRTHRVRLGAKGLRRGAYTVRVAATRNGRTVTSSITTFRL